MKAEILAALREADGYVSGQELCERFGVSRTAIWKSINQLKKDGYEIEAVQNKGYHILSAPDVMSENELVSIRKTKWVGNRICYYDVTDSTNMRAGRLAEEGAPHGTLVVADKQEAGRGRRGRGWDSPAHTGIFMTLLLKPEIEMGNASMLTLVAAMAVAKGIERCTESRVKIKWPNDIVMNGKKVCGILTELNAQIDYLNYIVIGIGINVHNTEFPEEIAQTATSIYLETGRHVKRAQLIEAVWEAFEDYYDRFMEKQDLSLIAAEYNEYLVNRDQEVRVLDPQEPFEGIARGITERGELLVETDGVRKKVSSGEVSVRGIYGYV
ncbi:MAG: biotin--[acetyl-CoA-carboxylase] ligase [Roseburia sp.]